MADNSRLGEPRMTTVAGVRMAKRIAKNRRIQDRDLRKTLAEAALSANGSFDPRTFRIIIMTLGGIAVLALLCVFLLTLLGKITQTTTIPATATAPATAITVPNAATDIFLSLGSAAVGALAGVVTGQRMATAAPAPGRAEPVPGRAEPAGDSGTAGEG